ncbi:MAG: efflux RND transporter permease subunit [Saprospiraceae bacterium]
MSLSTTSINRPVLTIVMNLLIILFGVIGFKYLGVREYPSIDPPVITVRTNYSGANADIIESQITEPLEKGLNGIAGIKSISSSSNQGSSVITVEFDISINMEAAANDVRDKVSQSVRQLPLDIDALPTVTKSDANADAIISMTFQSKNLSHLEVSDYAENVVAERLQTIPGVSNIQIWGQKKYAMRIWFDPVKLSAAGLTPLDVKQALDRENVELPSGKIAGDNTELTINTKGKLSSEDDFNNLIIKNTNGTIVRLRDIGKASLGSEAEETVLKESGVPMIGLALVPQPGANYIDISNEFYKRFEQLKKELPKDFSINIALDNTKFVKKAVNEVAETLLIAILLVIIIIFLFFRDWIVAFRPLIDIPVSLIGAFFIMYMMDYSINVLTLLAIVLATGLVVDDGIVVTENIFKKIEDGMSPIEAAKKGSNEILFAVLSTSVTLASVFLPVIFMQGFVGRLFQEFGVVLAGSVLISAFVSLTLTPMLNAKLVRKSNTKSKFYQLTEPYFEKLNSGYQHALNRFLSFRWMAFILIVVCGFMIWFFGSGLKSELAPVEDRSWMRILMSTPEGATFEYTDAVVDKMTQFIQDSIKEKRVCLTVTAPNFAGTGSPNSAFVRLALKDPDERKRSQKEIAQYIIQKSSLIPEAKISVVEQQTISTGGFGGLPIQFVLQAPDFERLKEKLPVFMEEASKNKTFKVVDANLKFNKPELNVSVNRDKARDLGVSVQDIAQTLQLAFSPQRLAYFNMLGKQYQVIGQFERASRDKPIDLKSIYVRNNVGQLIQLDNIVSTKESSSPPQLYHFNRYMSATVSAQLAPGKTIGEGIAAMEEIAAKTLDDSFTTALSGASRDFAESSSSLAFAFGLALLLVYLILSAQFESFRDPLIIMITVPLAIAGAVFSLWYFNQTLNIFSQIGIIMLIGLVTKNGILIVEFANKLQEKGMAKSEAILQASVGRLRPILMTSLATSLGALPIAISFGAASQSRMGMGIVVIGGLMFSLLLTLFVIPSMYSYISKKKHSTKTDHAELVVQ